MKRALHILRLVLLTFIVSALFIQIGLLVIGDQTSNHVLNIGVNLLVALLIVWFDGGIVKSNGKGNYGDGRN